MNTKEITNVLNVAFEYLGYSSENEDDAKLMSGCADYVRNNFPHFVKEEIEEYRLRNQRITDELTRIEDSVVELIREVLNRYDIVELELMETEDENCWIDVDKDTYATKVSVEYDDIAVYDNLGTRYYVKQSGVDMPELLYRILDTLENELSEKTEK